jgi:hypothetical protein
MAASCEHYNEPLGEEFINHFSDYLHLKKGCSMDFVINLYIWYTQPLQFRLFTPKKGVHCGCKYEKSANYTNAQ